MGGQLGTSKGPMADMNLAPLIDIVLVLLVVFMVITPMLQAGLPVDLPEARETTTVNDVGQHVVISVTTNQGVWVEQTEVTLDTLVDEINAEMRRTPDVGRSLLVKGDRALEYREVREVMDTLAEAGMTTVLIAAARED